MLLANISALSTEMSIAPAKQMRAAFDDPLLAVHILYAALYTLLDINGDPFFRAEAGISSTVVVLPQQLLVWVGWVMWGGRGGVGECWLTH
jgi:hypothetical protein